jgi:hypothetical protein
MFILRALLLALLAAVAAAYNMPQYTKYVGEATYYGAGNDGRGACGGNGFSTGPGGLMTVALNAPQYGNGENCGKCIEGTASGEGAGGNPIPSRFYAAINNLCPECRHGDIDFAVNGDGRWKVEWQVVPCDVAKGRKLLWDSMRTLSMVKNTTRKA